MGNQHSSLQRPIMPLLRQALSFVSLKPKTYITRLRHVFYFCRPVEVWLFSLSGTCAGSAMHSPPRWLALNLASRFCPSLIVGLCWHMVLGDLGMRCLVCFCLLPGLLHIPNPDKAHPYMARDCHMGHSGFPTLGFCESRVTGISPVKFRDRHIDKHARTRTSPSSTCIEGPRCGEIPTPVLLYDQMGKSSSNRASNNVSLFPLSHTTWQALAQIERAASKLFDLAAARVRGLSAAFLALVRSQLVCFLRCIPQIQACGSDFGDRPACQIIRLSSSIVELPGRD